MGEELLLDAPRDVTLAIETAGQPTDVEVLVNGTVVGRVPVGAGIQVVRAQVQVTRSSWIAARSAFVLTSPVYVLVSGRPIRPSPEDVCYLQRYVSYLRDLVSSRRLALFATTEESLRAYDEAAVELQRRFTESGGVTCG
jgi:hypothetical protein